MTVSLFNDQLILEVPEDTRWITFKQTPKTAAFCVEFYEYKDMITNNHYPYFSLYLESLAWFITSEPHDHCYIATEELLKFLHQSQAYEYW